MRPISSKSLAKIAYEELNETPYRIKQDLIILRLWIKQQKHWRARTSDDFLIAFLRYCQYSLEETKLRMERFFSFYTESPELFQHRCINERIFEINRQGVYFYPENPECNNQMALLIARFGVADYTRYNFREILQFSTIAMEIIALESDNAAVAGVRQIVDLDQIDLDRVHYIDRHLFAKWLKWVQLCCPLKIKEVYFINVPKVLQRRVAWHRLLMPWRSSNFPVILKSLDELYNYVPRKCLPEEYGGSNGHFAECIAYMEDLLKDYRAYFQNDYKYGGNEQLRKTDIVTYEADFGVSGSFRKLDAD